MKYMLLTYLDENAWLAMSKAEQQAEMAKCEPHIQRLAGTGKLLDGAPLHPTSAATTIRVKEKKRLVTDGPFAETREQIGGYTLIEAADLDEAIEIASGFLGDGSMATIEVRPVVESDHRRIWDADVEAFRDHWDAAVRTEEDFAAWFATPGIDTSLWRVAWDGDEVAGSVMNFVWPEENEQLGVARGWLEHISVRRPWRKRGLAGALIVDSLRALKAQGLIEGALGVDAENPSGALRLYESLGFRRHQTGIAFRKDL